jgi:hypothetical protein
MLHVLLIDKGSRTLHVDLRLPATAPATIERLLAPSPYSRTGVTLNGQQLNYAGNWLGTPRAETVAASPRGGYGLTLPRHSEALVSVPLAAAPSRGPAVSKHHRRVAVAKHAVLAVGLNRSRQH